MHSYTETSYIVYIRQDCTRSLAIYNTRHKVTHTLKEDYKVKVSQAHPYLKQDFIVNITQVYTYTECISHDMFNNILERAGMNSYTH